MKPHTQPFSLCQNWEYGYATENSLKRNKQLGATVTIHSGPDCPTSDKPLVKIEQPVNGKKCNYCKEKA